MRSSWILGVAVLLAGLAPAQRAYAKGGGIIVPPLEVDLGASFPIVGGDATEPGRELLVGMHWASIAWKPTSVDLGVGFVSSERQLVPGARGDSQRMSGSALHGEPASLELTGGYLALGKTLVDQRNFRTWLEVRGELLRGDLDGRSFSAVGGALRFAAELYSAGVTGSGGSGSHHHGTTIAIAAGTASIGVYLEASHRDLAFELGPTGVSGGVTFRIPFMLAATAY